IVADNIKEMLGLLQAIVSSPEVVSAPEQPSLVRLLPIALIGGIFEGLSLRGFLDNAQNSIFFGLREIYVSIVVRNVDDDIERVRHVSTPSGSRWLISAFGQELAERVNPRLTFHLRCVAEQLARGAAQWQSSVRLGPATRPQQMPPCRWTAGPSQ